MEAPSSRMYAYLPWESIAILTQCICAQADFPHAVLKANRMSCPLVFSVLGISAHVGSHLSYDSIFHAVTTSKAMKSSGLDVMPQKVDTRRLSWGLVQFDCSAVQEVSICCCDSEVINEWLAAFLSKCNLVLRVQIELCAHFTDVGVQAIATHCKQLSSIEIEESKLVTDDGVETLLSQCTALDTINFSGLQHVSDLSTFPINEYCTKLVEINMDYTDLSDIGTIFLTESCLQLQYVSVAGTYITISGAQVLAERCSLAQASAGGQNSRKIYNLCLWHNHVTLAELESLEAHFPRLVISAI